MYRREAGEPTTPELAAALNAADILAGVVLDVGTSPDAGDVVPHYRLVVHQAAGMVSVQLDVPIDEAMTRLRARAYGAERSIIDVAADVVDVVDLMDHEVAPPVRGTTAPTAPAPAGSAGRAAAAQLSRLGLSRSVGRRGRLAGASPRARCRGRVAEVPSTSGSTPVAFEPTVPTG